MERKEKIDWKRNATFATFGCFYLGGVQYAIYVPFFSKVFPHTKRFTELPVAQKLRWEGGRGLGRAPLTSES